MFSTCPARLRKRRSATCRPCSGPQGGREAGREVPPFRRAPPRGSARAAHLSQAPPLHQARPSAPGPAPPVPLFHQTSHLSGPRPMDPAYFPPSPRPCPALPPGPPIGPRPCPSRPRPRPSARPAHLPAAPPRPLGVHPGRQASGTLTLWFSREAGGLVSALGSSLQWAQTHTGRTISALNASYHLTGEQTGWRQEGWALSPAAWVHSVHSARTGKSRWVCYLVIKLFTAVNRCDPRTALH